MSPAQTIYLAKSIISKTCAPPIRVVLNVVASLLCLSPPGWVMAAPTDCMQSASDGTLRCTAPVVPARYTYGVCIANNLSTTESASSYCAGQLGPIVDESGIINFVNCVGNRLNPTNPTMTRIDWKPPGSTDSSASALCGPYQAVAKYGGVELKSFDHQSLFYEIFPVRYRVPECPRGYGAVNDTDGYPAYCIKPACDTCDKVGNPMSIGTAERTLAEVDYVAAGSSPLRFARAYSNPGLYRPMFAGSAQTPGFGDFWRHSYSGRIYLEGAPYLWTTAIRPDGTEKHFRTDGKEVLIINGAGDRLSNSGSLMYRAASNQLEVYSANGVLQYIVAANGVAQTLTYSDLATPLLVAPYPGLLINVQDSFGRALNFTYTDKGQLKTMQDPAGGIFTYGFDDREMLLRVDYPDAKFRSYIYNENIFATAGGPYSISGIFDENGARYATYRYMDGYWNTPDTTEHAGGVEKYVRPPYSGATVSITDPLGNSRTYGVATIAGVRRVTGQSQPAGSGSAPASTAKTFSSNGNLESATDFRGVKTCYAYEAQRNLETARVDGVAAAVDCASIIGAGQLLPAPGRKTSTQWHPDWRLPIAVAEPGRRTSWVYNGQPDPFAGNAIAACAPGSALLPDAKPIAVLCKRVEQATSDATGRYAFDASYVQPPADADPNFANVGLLLHMNGANGGTAFVDSSSSAVAVTANSSAQTSTAPVKFGTAAGKFDGSLGWLSAAGPSLNLSGGDFTIELWVYLNTAVASQVLYSQYPTGVELRVDAGGDVYFQPAGSASINTGGGAVGVGAWNHLAIVRSGSSTTIYVNGVVKAASTTLPAAGSSTVLSVGARYSTHASTLNGYMDDLRVTKGVARYPFAFTPPTAQYGDSVAGTGGSTVVQVIDAAVPARTWAYTYNQNGQVLTANGPRTDVVDTASYAYYTDTTADHTIGDLQSMTNAIGAVTSYIRYDKHGQLLESVDPNGVHTVNTYDARLRLLSTSVGGQATAYTYDPAGQLTRVTRPDASYIGYEYDDAHRMKAVLDNKGNRIEYTLDNVGNRTVENVKDPAGVLTRTLTRSIDALGRVRQVTGRE